MYPSISQAQDKSLQNRALLENVNRLQGQLNDLQQSYNALKKELDSLKSEVRRARAESLKSKPNINPSIVIICEISSVVKKSVTNSIHDEIL